MYGFSMTPPAKQNEQEKAFEMMELGTEYVGFIKDQLYQDYKFLQTDFQATYDIKIKRLPGQGKPKFYVKTMD